MTFSYSVARTVATREMKEAPLSFPLSALSRSSSPPRRSSPSYARKPPGFSIVPLPSSPFILPRGDLCYSLQGISLFSRGGFAMRDALDRGHGASRDTYEILRKLLVRFPKFADRFKRSVT